MISTRCRQNISRTIIGGESGKLDDSFGEHTVKLLDGEI